ncbi:MAG: hypothetical protein E7541_07645 [Ruminococcaceae bacterium]|nr:hypothetical protein [Oscillospiraceae bacterium]
MAKIDPTVRRETAAVALWVAIGGALLQGVFLLCGWWDYTVLTGAALGGATAVGNFLLVGLMIQKAITQTQKQAKNTVRLSQGGRLLLQGAILCAAALLPWFNIWATAIPLLIPRIAVSVRAYRIKNGQPRTIPDDEDDEDEEELTEVTEP